MAGEYDFKRTSAQIETLLNQIPAEGDVAKVYNTTLDVFGIQDGSVVTQEQNDEVINIMDKWMKGYLVTYVDTRQNTFHYGVLNVCRCDDGVPTSLSVINDRGDLLAYSFKPGEEDIWTVTNKTNNNFYCFNTDLLLNHTDGLILNDHDNALVNKLRSINTDLSDAVVAYCGIGEGNLTQVVPLALHSIISRTASDFNIKLCYAGESGNNYSLLITPTSAGNKYVSGEPILVSGSSGDSKIYETTFIPDTFNTYLDENFIPEYINNHPIDELINNVVPKVKDGYIIKGKYSSLNVNTGTAIIYNVTWFKHPTTKLVTYYITYTYLDVQYFVEVKETSDIREFEMRALSFNIARASLFNYIDRIVLIESFTDLGNRSIEYETVYKYSANNFNAIIYASFTMIVIGDVFFEFNDTIICNINDTETLKFIRFAIDRENDMSFTPIIVRVYMDGEFLKVKYSSPLNLVIDNFVSNDAYIKLIN